MIFRANIPPMFILNSSAPIQVLAIPFESNKPISATVTIHIQIQGINVRYNFTDAVNILSGQGKEIYLPAINRTGHYNMILYADYHGLLSRKVNQDFAVCPAPRPYQLYFDPDGSHIHFKSLVLNATGHIDPNVTFTIQIYCWNGQQQSLVATYRHITNITIPVPESWKTGILIVNVIDEYGWVNGMTINLAAFQFQGAPVQYDYHYAQREPFASRQLWYLVAAVVVILGIAYGIRRWYDGK
ncbi:MAG: hypothetical protein GXO25_01705 [Euryarchaeota archaeon]|nr:hypothetical protein [Euryarchaeota archaeon]